MTLTIAHDRSLIRDTGGSRRFILARITAPTAPERDTRLPVNVAVVLDRSGSMESDAKFALARPAVEKALALLNERDRFSLVVYDDHVDVLASSRPATAEAVRDALRALWTTRPRGSTDLAQGWLAGCEEVARHLDASSVNRCLLLSDGLANHGLTDRRELSFLAAKLRRRGVATSTFGLGADFDELLLRDMAHSGGGNAWFIEGASQIPALLGTELGEALEVTLRNASLAIALPAGCSARPVNRFRHRLVRDECVIDLGDLVSGQVLDVVVEVRFPAIPPGDVVAGVVELRSTGEAVEGARAAVEWTSAGYVENARQPRNVEVDRAVATQFAARARAEATEANRHGDFGRARRVLEGTARRIRSYAGRDPNLVEMARALRDEVAVYSDAMSPMALKMSFYVAESALRDRDTSGRAKRTS
jgi:Ca-activated chloride channel family protein